MHLRLPTPCLVVLIGPSGSGKSTWAAEQFRPDQVVSSDRLRALVGEGEHDQRAGTDAFDVLDLVVERRLKRGLVTVVDSLGLDPARRAKWLAAAAERRIPAYAVVFDVPAEECRRRNKARAHAVPSKVLTAQLASFAALETAGFAAVHSPGAVRLVPSSLAAADSAAARQREHAMSLTFGLQLPSFSWTGGPAELRPKLATFARAAEDAGFESLWVMDHFLQIPYAGREWEDMLESYTTLGYLAGVTASIRLGAMVTGVTYRNVAHLAKIVATLDVLSGGRAICGIGAAWFEREHRAYGWPFPPLSERYALLEDALQVLPLMWGPGAPPFEGKVVKVREAMCYPRPLQRPLPILVGGSGERKTLRLVAQYADACNLFGDAATVRHKVDVLHRHCADLGRDPAEVAVTHLSTALVAKDAEELREIVERRRPPKITAEAYSTQVNAGTVDDHVGRFRELAEAGVQTAMVSLADLDETTPIERFGEVISAFRVR